jgi:hypothetical protein
MIFDQAIIGKSGTEIVYKFINMEKYYKIEGIHHNYQKKSLMMLYYQQFLFHLLERNM